VIGEKKIAEKWEGYLRVVIFFYIKRLVIFFLCLTAHSYFKGKIKAYKRREIFVDVVTKKEKEGGRESRRSR
jgi:hypothetical protein